MSFQVLRLPELTQQPQYSTNKLRVQNRQRLVRTLAQRYATGTCDALDARQRPPKAKMIRF